MRTSLGKPSIADARALNTVRTTFHAHNDDYILVFIIVEEE